MQTSCTCEGERYHYQVSAQNKSFEDCLINHLRMPTPFHTMTKKKVLKQNHQLQIFLHSGARESDILCSSTTTASCSFFCHCQNVNCIQHPLQLHHKLPLMSAMARMSNQNVSGCEDKSHETEKKKSLHEQETLLLTRDTNNTML